MTKLIALMAVIVAAFMLAGLAYAGEEEDPNHDVYVTSGTVFETPYAPLTSWLNSNVSSTSDIYISSRRNPMGVGGIIEYKFNPTWSVMYDTEIDFANDNEWSNFVKGRAVFGNK